MCTRSRMLGKEAEEQKPLGSVSAAEIDNIEQVIPLHPSCIDDGVVRRGPDEVEKRAHLGEVAAHCGGHRCMGILVRLEGAAHALPWLDHAQR